MLECALKIRWRPFIEGATEGCRYGCLLASVIVWAGLVSVISANGGALTINDVIFVLFGVDAASADYGAVDSDAALAAAAWHDVAVNSSQSSAARGTDAATPSHQWPARQPDGTRWGWQPDGATGCHPFCSAKHCGSRPDCASCVICPNRTKELPWAAVADHAARHHQHLAHTASTRPPRNVTGRIAVSRRRWNVSSSRYRI